MHSQFSNTNYPNTPVIQNYFLSSEFTDWKPITVAFIVSIVWANIVTNTASNDVVVGFYDLIYWSMGELIIMIFLFGKLISIYKNVTSTTYQNINMPWRQIYIKALFVCFVVLWITLLFIPKNNIFNYFCITKTRVLSNTGKCIDEFLNNKVPPKFTKLEGFATLNTEPIKKSYSTNEQILSEEMVYIYEHFFMGVSCRIIYYFLWLLGLVFFWVTHMIFFSTDSTDISGIYNKTTMSINIGSNTKYIGSTGQNNNNIPAPNLSGQPYFNDFM